MNSSILSRYVELVSRLNVRQNENHLTSMVWRMRLTVLGLSTTRQGKDDSFRLFVKKWVNLKLSNIILKVPCMCYGPFPRQCDLLNPFVSNSYYGMPRRQIHTNSLP